MKCNNILKPGISPWKHWPSNSVQGAKFEKWIFHLMKINTYIVDIRKSWRNEHVATTFFWQSETTKSFEIINKQIQFREIINSKMQ